jgi:integrase
MGRTLGRRPDATSAVYDFVFHRRGRPVGDFDRAWTTACRAAGCPGKLFHDLRRTAAGQPRRAGVPEGVALQVTGHRTRSIFDRYSIVDDEDIREALVKVQALVETLPTERTVVPLRTAVGS